MNKRLKFAVMLLAGVLYAVPAKADIEAIEAAINAFVIKYEAVKKQVQDVLTEAKNLSSEVKQGFRDAKKDIQNIKDFKLDELDPKEIVKTAVLSGMENSVDEKPNEDENVETVKSTYNRTWGEDHNNTVARKLRESINRENQVAAAQLYARALILRQELLEEEDPEYSLNTIEEAFNASNSMQLRSLARWERIMGMQDAINSYKSTMAIQNYENEKSKTQEGDNAEK